MRKFVLFALVFFGFSCSAYAAKTHDAHEHGAAEMNIAVAGTAVTIELDSPLDNLT